ncbi:LPD7 domain-containing protein [Pseudomonas sp. DC3000-4b1]|uniref:LPD7 domain-containing protein n=1 Tax=unclassified Pseudomonas TaxID=196821 RepID=UPI003CF35353
MLFDPLKRPAEQPLVFKRAPITALTANKHASTVAAYFTREAQYNQILPAHRHALRRLDQQFYSTRRAVFADERLTRQDKAQLISVLTFERLRAREQLRSPQPSKEVDLMGSAAIRELIEDEKDEPGFTITGAKGPSPEGVRDRVKRIMDRFAKQVDPQAAEERARDLSAKDLYTKKAKFSQNVHYLDKATDKTLFVDTGKAISMRRTGITESGVAVALELAKERFGSTLTINGTADFKKLVIEAAAKNGLDIHFTDKAMNQGLAARRAELAIEKEGQSIEPGVAPAPDAEKPVAERAAESETTATAPTAEAAAPAKAGPDPDLQSPSELVRREALYRQNMGMKEADVHASDTIMSLRGEDHAMWLIGTGDSTPEAAAMLTAYMERDHYREAFKETIEAAYRQVGGSPEALKALDEVTGLAEKIVNEVEGRLRMADAPATAPAATTAAAPTANAPEGRSRVIEGELVDHGAARYQHQDDKQMSYFVTLKTDAGERTVWGVGLEEAMNASDLARGDQVRLEDHGTRPVIVQEVAEDGTVKEKMTNRREWSAEPALPEREVADTTPKGLAVAAGTPELPEPEPESGMSTD